MKKFKHLAIAIVIFEILIMITCNLVYLINGQKPDDKTYRVEAKKVLSEIENDIQSIDIESLSNDDINSYIRENIDFSIYSSVIGAEVFDPNQSCNDDYVVQKSGDKLFRIKYKTTREKNTLTFLNIGLIFILLITIGVFIYIYKKILKPFADMSNLTTELAKGNLSTPIEEEKSKYFGKFLWGMDMLRENLESSKTKELEYQKEKKTLILSLSHDIKTPLSAIELYSKALKSGLYDTDEKKEEAILGIEKNAKEIERYVSEITKATREDFMNLTVTPEEFYLQDVISSIKNLYIDKFAHLHTEFIIEEYENVLLKGDLNRVIEVVQNLLENAIKYGDGKKVSISFSEEENFRLIAVENSGNTLKEDVTNIFDSFYRGSNTDGIKGSGLGLYICKNLLNKMNGDIYAETKDDIFRVVAVIPEA